MARYGRKAQQKVKKAMHERKRGALRSGRSGRKVMSRKQAIAIVWRTAAAWRASSLAPPVRRSRRNPIGSSVRREPFPAGPPW